MSLTATSFLYTNLRLFDGTGDQPLTNAQLLVEGNRIVDAGTSIERPTDVREVDLGGRTVVPGLINMHDHITWRRGTESFEERVLRRPMVELLARSAGQALVSLLEGETTIRDCASKDGTAIVLKNAINRGELRGPRIFSVGAAIGMSGGHATGVIRNADGVAEVRKAAREQIHRGADWIKVMASGGFLLAGIDQPTSIQMTPDEVRAAFDEAHRAGKRTTAHAHPPAAIRMVVEAGADCVEHAGLIDRDTIALLADRGTYVCPTLSFLRFELELAGRLGRSDWLTEKMRSHLDSQAEIFGWMLEAGIPIVPGTDGNGDLGHELRYMVELGLTPAQAIISATAVSAACLGESDRIGTLEPGKLADFVVLDGDPLVDITNIRNVYLTVKDGDQYWPDILRAAIGTRQPSEHLEAYRDELERA